MLVPAILAVRTISVYTVQATTFDLMLMAEFGLMGYLLRKQGVPMALLILGLVLGDMMEQNLRRALSITDEKSYLVRESDLNRPLDLRSYDGYLAFSDSKFEQIGCTELEVLIIFTFVCASFSLGRPSTTSMPKQIGYRVGEEFELADLGFDTQGLTRLAFSWRLPSVTNPKVHECPV